MKQFIKKNITIITSLVLIILVYVIFKDIDSNIITAIDSFVINYVQNIRSVFLNEVVIIYTDVIGVIIPLIISIICLLNFKKKEYLYIPLNLGLITIINQALKYIIQRPRPESALIEQIGFSFPSGHAMISAAFYGLLIYYVSKGVGNIKLKYIVNTILMFLIISTGISRLYLGVHYASDVIAGFVITAAYLPIYIRFIVKDLKNSSEIKNSN